MSFLQYCVQSLSVHSEQRRAAFASYVRGDKVNPYTYDYELALYKNVLRACGIEA